MSVYVLTDHINDDDVCHNSNVLSCHKSLIGAMIKGENHMIERNFMFFGDLNPCAFDKRIFHQHCDTCEIIGGIDRKDCTQCGNSMREQGYIPLFTEDANFVAICKQSCPNIDKLEYPQDPECFIIAWDDEWKCVIFDENGDLLDRDDIDYEVEVTQMEIYD